MIFDTNKVTFEVVRGDTFSIPIELNAGSRERPNPYSLKNGDRIYIGIMLPGQPFEEAVLRVALDETSPRDFRGNTLLRLTHTDTKNLEPGKYYISIKFVSDGEVSTLVNQKQFFVTGTEPVRCLHG